MNDSSAKPVDFGSNEHPFTTALKELMLKHDVCGVMLYVLPETSEKGYHTFTRGHFYDNAKLLSDHVRSVKSQMSHDLEGLV